MIVAYIEPELHFMIVGVPNVRRDVTLLIQRPVKSSHRLEPVVDVRIKQIRAELFIEESCPLVRKFNILLDLTDARAVRTIDEDEFVSVGVSDERVLVRLKIRESKIRAEDALELTRGRLLGAIGVR